MPAGRRNPCKPFTASNGTRWWAAWSATHTIAGAIAGVGTVNGVGAVRWNIAGEIVFAWALTLPAAGAMGAGIYGLARLF